MLRIVAGKHRGRRLKTPRNHRTRPTAQRVREAVFDVLAHGVPETCSFPLPKGACVLDLFAGSGAMGFESLSRGAEFVTFLETDPTALALLSKNAQALGEEARVKFVPMDATRLGQAGEAVELVFLDPPYGRDLSGLALEALHEEGWLKARAVIVVELGAKETLLLPKGFHAVDERYYGAAKVVFLIYEEPV